MKIFDAGQDARGFIAFGQQATGFFAFGQIATGVIAIGQVARGGIAIGQVAFGLVGWGQGGAGIFHAAGMIGVGGRRGLGIVLPLVPSLGRPRVLPPATTLDAVEAGNDGWIEADLTPALTFEQGGVRLPIKLDRRLQARALGIVTSGPRRVRAYTRRVGARDALRAPGAAVLVCDRIAHEPPRPYEKKGFWTTAALQTAALFVLGVAYAAIVGHDLAAVIADGVTGAPSHAPAAPARPGKGRSR